MQSVSLADIYSRPLAPIATIATRNGSDGAVMKENVAHTQKRKMLAALLLLTIKD